MAKHRHAPEAPDAPAVSAGLPAGPEVPLTYARVLAIALPVVLSNATVPLQGAIDTAIIGNLGDTVLLAAVALGATVMSFVFGIFNFLQIGVSGTAAQALGARNPGRVVNTLLRALALAQIIALALILLQGPIAALVLGFFEASAGAEAAARAYFAIRIWGGPLELANYALMGWFAGQERTRRLFEMQLAISVSNVALTLLLVMGLGLGIEGLALGTVAAQGVGLAYGFWQARRRARAILPPGWRAERARILDPGELGALLRLNRDIFIRSLLLIASFAWITRLGSMQGDVVLAANGVLMAFFAVSTAGLDGFAIAAESLVGQAKGAGSRARLRRAVVVSTVSAFALATVFSVLLLAGASTLIRLFTTVEAVRAVAEAYAVWAALIPLAGVAAFQLDGIFIGAAAGPAIRNAMVKARAERGAALADAWGWLFGAKTSR
ncbi:MAG: MATE family efflux transporter [Pseudomonadota bacterium]